MITAGHIRNNGSAAVQNGVPRQGRHGSQTAGDPGGQRAGLVVSDGNSHLGPAVFGMPGGLLVEAAHGQ